MVKIWVNICNKFINRGYSWKEENKLRENWGIKEVENDGKTWSKGRK